MGKTNIEILFEWMDQTTETIHLHEDLPYLDSLAIALETLFFREPSDDMDDILSHKIQTALKSLDWNIFSTEEFRKSIQLVILKGMSKSTQQQHLITPEAVSLFIGYLAGKFTAEKEQLRIFDPVSGTASLLTTVLSQLKQPTEAFASEIDPTLIKLALANANLQKMNIEFFHQDSLQPFLLDPVDLVVADLPVGYYPDDIQAQKFVLKAAEGHSYAHHLIIEQSLHYTKEGGYLLLIIPEFLFESDQSKALQLFIHDHAHIIGVLRLPGSAFTSEKNIKSILMLRKKGKEVHPPKQPLLVDMPSFNNKEAMKDIIDQMNSWFTTY